MAVDVELDYRHWRKQHASVFPAVHSSFALYSGRPEVGVGLQELGFSSFDNFSFLGDEGLFLYDAALYSGGGAELDIGKSQKTTPMMWNRRPDTLLISDSGGYQVQKGLIQPQEYYNNRQRIQDWQEAISDIAIAMDVPTGSIKNTKATALNSFNDCLQWTKTNFDWQVENRHPQKARMLNVIQGTKADGPDGALQWYEAVKGYCDRSKWGENAFDGWSFGGQGARNTVTALRVIVRMLQDGLLGKDSNHRWLHFLGVASSNRVASFSLIQQALRKLLQDEDLTVSCDASNASFLVGQKNNFYAETPTGFRMKKVLNASWFHSTCGKDCEANYSKDSKECEICAWDRFLHYVRHLGSSSLAGKLSFEGFTSLVDLDYGKMQKEREAAALRGEDFDSDDFGRYSRLTPEGYVVYTFISQEMFLRNAYEKAAEIVSHKAGMVDRLIAAFKSETPDTAVSKIRLD
ncbi:MAG TPA: hypothetical protein VM661_08425 [Candidatus Sulfotelmatobacter sp.]|jgi:hypothetical protein|nr:hypothetical protein [Candidatus Sulfotelmatobacter sp.]